MGTNWWDTLYVRGTTRTSEPIFRISEVMPSIPKLFFGLSAFNNPSTTFSLKVFRLNFNFKPLNFALRFERSNFSTGKSRQQQNKPIEHTVK